MSKVALIYKKHATEVEAGVETLVSKVRDWQVIKQYMCNRLPEIKLTEDQKKKMERYNYIYSQQVSGKYTDSDIVKQVMNLFDIKTCPGV